MHGISKENYGEHDMKKICVIGGGNIGHYLIAIAGSRGYEVSLFTSAPEKWNHKIVSHDKVHGIDTTGTLVMASNNPEEVIPGADILLVALPSNAYSDVFGRIKPYIASGTYIGFIPGTGGAEFLCADLVKNGCTLFGTQRVPSGTSIVAYGKEVNSLGSRKDLRVATMSMITGDSATKEVSSFMQNMLDIDTITLPNYLAVTLTPSNPILHTSRLYSIFKEYSTGQTYEAPMSFYKAWSDYSSEILLECDSELQELLAKLTAMDMSSVLSLRQHYEIAKMNGENDVDKLTKKIRTLPFLKDTVPMIKVSTPTGEKYAPNLASRFFLEDFPYGLCIIKSFCAICDISTPRIDEVLHWYERLLNKEYYLREEFEGSDLKQLLLPQNFGIDTIEKIYQFYK